MENKQETEKAMETADEVNKTPGLLEETKKVAAQIKAENDRYEALIARNEKIQSHNILSGVANAGREPVKEETNSEYKDRIMRGVKK